MKIFFISHSSVIYNYREKLRLLSRRKDVELALLLPHTWPEAGQRARTAPQTAEREGFPIISAPVVFPGRVKRHFYPSLFNHIRDFKPDIIHVEEEPYSLAAWQALRAARRLGAAFVFFTWENLLERFPFPHGQIRRYVLRHSDHAIAGDQEADQLLHKAGVPASKTSVIPQYGVNPGLFRKKDRRALRKKLKLGSFTVGYVGRLVPEKGVHHLLEAFALLKSPRANLLVVGSGPLQTRLEDQAEQLGIAGRVRWVKAVDQSLIPDYLNCMDALVLPSLTTKMWKEQFGRVIIEAQACGVPVVGSDSGAIPEVIGKAGLIFREGRVGELAEKLRRLAGSAGLRQKLAASGSKRVLELYTNQKIADQIHRVYQRVLENRTPG